MLQLHAESTQKRIELYEQLAGEATRAQDLDRREQEVMDKLFQDAADAGAIDGADPPTAGGHYDPCSDAEIRINYTCASGLLPPPLCDWVDEGLKAHEQAHQQDAINNENNDTWTYCNTEGTEEAQIASRWEVHAYGKQLEVYNEMLDALRDLYPECFE